MRSFPYPWRIAIDRARSYELLGLDGVASHATFAGDANQRPVVGDFVDVDNANRIVAVAERQSWIARARATGNAQLVAANVTSGFIVTSPEPREFSPRRIVRYLIALRSGRVEPIVVLNKCDAGEDVSMLVTALREVAGDAPVIAISARDGNNVEALDAYVRAGDTVALCGSSGVGKSTLLNRLAGIDVMATTEMRVDGRGRHTTTFRRLIALPNGAALVDTPGMRAFTPWATTADAAGTFSELAALASACRFNDCRHASEPGCAVRDNSSSERLEQWQKLQRELHWAQTRDDRFAARERKNAWKQIHKAARAQRRHSEKG